MQQGTRYDRQVAIWLLCVCVAIFIMLVIGGTTRLTHSGLSMMTWDPLMGWIPPLSEAAWLDSFEHYKKIPEFYELNPNMDLEGYKGIFLLEYVHRVWGRMIGLLFLLPFLFLAVSGRIKRSMTPKLLMMFLLGGLQGVMGWYMVSSGFDNPHVSQYRLTAHLSAAFIIYGYILWVAMGLIFEKNDVYDAVPLRRMAWAVTGLIAVTIVAGGFVAGLKAGFTYNTFPLMEGRFIPEGYGMLQPFYRNFLDNIAAVQFDHRLLAEMLLLSVVGLWWYSRRFSVSSRSRLALNLLLAMAGVQVSLGIATLVLAVPVWLGVSHQAGAMLLFSFALLTNHSLRRG